MAKRKNQKELTEPDETGIKVIQRLGNVFRYLETSKWIRESFGIFLIALTVFILISLFTIGKTNGILSNSCGELGIRISGYMWYYLGIASLVIPIILAVFGIICFRHRQIERKISRFLGLLLLTPSICSLMTLLLPNVIQLRGYNIRPGGRLGDHLTSISINYLGNSGTIVLFVTCVLITFLVVTDVSYYIVLSRIKLWFKTTLTQMFRSSDKQTDILPGKSDETKQISHENRQFSIDEMVTEPTKAQKRRSKKAFLPLEKGNEDAAQDRTPELNDPIEIVRKPIQITPRTITEKQAIHKPPEPNLLEPNSTAFQIPDLSLLTEPPSLVQRESEEELLKKSEILINKLNEFNIKGRITEVCPGPVITRYEFEPAPGIKISKITSLADDLALGLKSRYGLRVTPIPGKSTLGVELPNKNRETVFLKEILISEEYNQAKEKSILSLPLGKDTSGKPFIADLQKMPHLLIAGATGSGKSVCINTILTGLLFSSTPKQLRLLLIDPKMLELSDFNGIPHLREPVITDVKLAPDALNWAVDEMTQRYSKLAAIGARNIDQFNEKVASSNYEGEEQPLPYMVIIIDELADLMLTTPTAVEESIQRLAQMARAAGIHLIIATQRPSVDVITGVIKANLPCRLAFQVASRVDARTIMDRMGAEKLLGMGDSLFIPPGTSQLMRIHGAFVSEGEVKRVVEFLRQQPRISDEESIFQVLEESKADFDGVEDPLFDQAVKIVLTSGLASISLLQRRLKVGHSRASRLIDYMEQQNIVGPHIGSKTREILVDREEYLERLNDIETSGVYDDI